MAWCFWISTIELHSFTTKAQSEIPWCLWWVAVLVFQWELYCLWLLVWRWPTAWLHSAFWCTVGRSAFSREQLCSSNLHLKKNYTEFFFPQLDSQWWQKSIILKQTSVFEDFLIRLHHRAEAVEDQCSQFGCVPLWRLVIVEWVGGEDKPALLQLQRSALGSGFHLFMQPA